MFEQGGGNPSSVFDSTHMVSCRSSSSLSSSSCHFCLTAQLSFSETVFLRHPPLQPVLGRNSSGQWHRRWVTLVLLSRVSADLGTKCLSPLTPKQLLPIWYCKAVSWIIYMVFLILYIRLGLLITCPVLINCLSSWNNLFFSSRWNIPFFVMNYLIKF